MNDAIQTIEPFAYGFLSCPSKNLSRQIASGMLENAKVLPLLFDEEVVFPNAGWKPAVTYLFGGGICVDVGRLDNEAKEHPELADDINHIKEVFLPQATGRLIGETQTELDRKFMANHTGWGGTWGGHSNPDYQMLLEMGTDGLRDRIAKYRPQHPEASDWYDASLTALEALDTVGDRCAIEAAELAQKVDSPEIAKLYSRLAEAFKIVPRRPAPDFLAACACFYLCFTFDGTDSPGRFDQFMLSAYNNSDPDDARMALEHLWIGFHKLRAWNLCIGGSDENWNDMSNPLTYEVMAVARKFLFNTPNITLRCHRNTPKKIFDEAYKTLATGIGMPALYNDEVVCPALEALGIPPVDSHNYCMNGCNQIDIQGKSHMGLEDGEISVVKCLEYALFNGECLHTHEIIGPQTGDARDFATFDEFFAAYKKQLDWAVEMVVNMANKAQRVYGEHAPNPFRSNMIRGCVEHGKDYKHGGPFYNHGQILTEGLADAADSLAAIKHFVYDTHEISMDELLTVLRNDFKDNEQLRLKLRDYKAKFGNDNPEVDDLAAEIIRHHYSDMARYRTWRDPVNGIYGGGLSTFQRTATYGSTLGATASGRHAGDPNLADSIGAVPGFDTHGPTAAIKSALSYDHKLAKSGFVFQLKFETSLFNTPEGRDGFIGLWKTFFNNGGQQLSVNVLDSAALLEAQKEPDKYRDLIVRVGGYSEYFVRLPANLQNNIIARTLY